MPSNARERLGRLVESHSGYARKPHLDQLYQMKRDGEIEITEYTYSPSGHIDWFVEGTSNEESKESNRHLKFKRHAVEYLKETGCESVEVEKDTWFGVADAACLDCGRYVEVGAVRVEKFIEALGCHTHPDFYGEPNPRYDTVKELLYVPYIANEQAPPITMISIQKAEDE